MTARVLLWCGYVKEPRYEARRTPRFDYDFPASVRDLEFAINAALSLGVRRDEVYAFVCRQDLLPHDFRSSYHPATIEALETTALAIARRASDGDALLFVASNHGLPEGLLSSAEVDEFSDGSPQILTPDVLGRALEPLTGPQVLVVAACHAGAFLRLGDRPNRRVLAACSETEKYYVEGEERPHSPFLIRLLSAWSGTAFPDEVPPQPATLDDAWSALLEESSSHGRAQPLSHGSVAWP